nr:hypothetical protein [Tanacetum cinerariifolium]
TVKFGNDQIAPIIGYGDLVQGAVTIKRVYYVEGLNHNLFSIGSHGTDLYSITLQDSTSPNLICLMAKATSSQAWLWHHRLSHLNFDIINLLLKNDIVIGLPKLKFVKDHLCSSLIVDDYSRYTWIHFLRSKDETPEVLIDFLRLVQRGLHAQVRIVRTDKGTEFLNQTLHAYFASEGILHKMLVARTPEQNGVVKRQNHTLVEAAQTMLSAANVPLFFWAEAITTTCFTQNRSLVIPWHEKTPYHIINDRKPSVKFFYIFGSLCYIVRDGENQDKMKEKGDACIFVVYSTQSKSYKTTPLNNKTTTDPTCQALSQAPTVTSTENINQAKMIEENAQVEMMSLSTFFVHRYKTEGRRRLIMKELISKNHLYQLLDWKLYGCSLHKVYRLKKALYGLKQAPRAWGDILLVQIYVDDIIFGSTNPKLSKQFEKLMHSKFEMSMMGELKFFLGIQIYQSPSGIFINQAKYAQEILIKHGMTSCDSIGTPMATKHQDADLSGTPINQMKYHSMVGALMYLTSSCLDSRKSTSGGIQFLGGDKLVSWSSKTHDCTSMSFAEAEYVSLSACYAQVLWMRTQIIDYGFHFDKIPIYHFIKEKVEKGIVELFFVTTEYQLADLFIKALPEERFKYLVRRLGMRCLTPEELEARTNESA